MAQLVTYAVHCKAVQPGLNGVMPLQTYGHELADAYTWCKRYQDSRRDADLQQAWDLYYHIFRRINKYLPTVHTLDLRNVSHILAHATDLELAVPGTYIAGEPVLGIASFASKLTVRAFALLDPAPTLWPSPGFFKILSCGMMKLMSLAPYACSQRHDSRMAGCRQQSRECPSCLCKCGSISIMQQVCR